MSKEVPEILKELVEKLDKECEERGHHWSSHNSVYGEYCTCCGKRKIT